MTLHTLDDDTTHPAELEQGKYDTGADRISNLRTPIHVTVGGEMVSPAFLGMNHVRKGLGIRLIRMTEIHVVGFLCMGQEGDVIFMSGVDVI